MTLSLLLLIIGTSVAFVMSVLGVILSSLVSSGWIIPTILFIIAFIVLAILLACAVHKKLTDPAKKERFLSESSDDKYAQYESEYIEEEKHENSFEEESEDAFELVQANSKIFDKKFDTKAVGYWTDAVKRFCRNKASLVCFVLLAILILLSIFGEAMSPYSAEVPVNNRFRYLAPKWPLINKLGILDGTSKVSDANLNAIVFINDETRENFKYKDLMSNLDSKWYKPQDYDIEQISGAQQYDSRFIVSMEKPVLVKKMEQVRDEKGNVVKDPETGEVLLYEAFYYTVTFKYDRYAYFMLDYAKPHQPTTSFMTYVNNALEAEGLGNKKINEATIKAIVATVKQVVARDANGNIIPDLSTGTPFIDETTGLPVPDLSTGTPFIDPETGEPMLDHINCKPVLDANGNPVIDPETGEPKLSHTNCPVIIDPSTCDPLIDPSTCDPLIIAPKKGVYYPELGAVVNEELLKRFGVSSVEELPVYLTAASITNTANNFNMIIDPVVAGEIDQNTYFVFGTDGVGRDMWCRIWSGLGLSMLIGLAVGIFSIVFGICWGAVCGYYGGLIDIIMERFTDILVNVPSMIILTLLNLHMGTSGKGSVLVFILALIMTSWVGIASRTRIQFYRYKNREYVLASRTMGAKDRRLIFKHILPNGIGPLVNSAVAIIPASMRFETSMSYLGIASMSENSIGQIISSASDFVTKPEAYLLLIPSIIFSIIMVSFSVMGLGLRDALNPSLRGS